MPNETWDEATLKRFAGYDKKLAAVKAKVDARYKAFDTRRKKLIASYEKAKTPKAKLLALAKIVRQHGEYMDQGLASGWQTTSVIGFAGHIEANAENIE